MVKSEADNNEQESEGNEVNLMGGKRSGFLPPVTSGGLWDKSKVKFARHLTDRNSKGKEMNQSNSLSREQDGSESMYDRSIYSESQPSPDVKDKKSGENKSAPI